MIQSGDTGSLCSQDCVQILRLKRFLLSPLREQNCHLETSNWGRLAICYVERAKEVSVNWIRIPLPHQHCIVIFEKEGLYGLSEGTVLNGSLCSTVCWCLNLSLNNLLLAWFMVIFFIVTTLKKYHSKFWDFTQLFHPYLEIPFWRTVKFQRQDIRPYRSHLDLLSLCPFVFR